MPKRQTPRKFLQALGIVSYSMAEGTASSAVKRNSAEKSKASRPNIILIMADDLG